VLQEEVLSHRGLIFEREGIRWTCNSDESSESHPHINSVRSLDTGDIIRSTYSSFRTWMSGQDPTSAKNRWPRTHERLDILDLWYKLVENYSQRDLTEHSDALPALSGLASAFHGLRGTRYLAGLWESDMQLGLLWRAHHPQLRPQSFPQSVSEPYYASKPNSRSVYDTDSSEAIVPGMTLKYDSPAITDDR
jgi:hypothetical protein